MSEAPRVTLPMRSHRAVRPLPPPPPLPPHERVQEIVAEANAAGNACGVDALAEAEWIAWIEDLADRACSPYEIEGMYEELVAIVADLRRAS